MKKTVYVMMATLCAFTFASCHKGGGNAALRNTQDTLSWVVGQSCGQSVAASGVKLDKALVMKAFEDALDGNCRISDTSRAYRQALDYFNGELMMSMKRVQEERINDQRSFEKQYFEKLVKENKNVQKAESGFYYEVLKSGKGRKAEHGLVVTFDYKGLLTTGQVFDQTYGNREPIRHVVGAPMFQGMQNAFEMMREGDVWRCYFPSELAFGAEGSEDIAPFSAVIYEIEVKSVED